ncbi:MAG: PAS domain-containing protein, partial [Candidatus Anammoxibacter sp.]
GWTANIHPDDLKRLLEEYSSAFKAKREFKIEYRHRRFDNKYRWILNTGVPRFTNDGGFAGYIGSCIDINERKQAEETIQSIVEKHPDGILIVDMDGIVRFTNRSAEFIFKRTKEKLKDKMFGLPLTANDMTEIGIIRKTGEPGIGEMRKDITKWKGKPAYLVSIRDITERKKAEEGLRMSEANLAEAQRIGHMGNVEWDIVNDKVYMSEEVYQIYGLKPDDFGNNYQAYKSTVHPDDIEFYEKSTNEALYKNKPYRIEHRIIRPDGAVRIVHKHAIVTFDDAGKPIRMFGTVHDITERKKREDELLKTQKLESIGILAGGIAHDFNNILTAILGFTNLAIINAKEDDKICKNLVKVEKATIRAKDLTQQLLTFSKGGAPIRKAVSIAELIKDAAEFALRGKNIKCKFSISTDLWPVDVDEGQINQVINNLVINSVQAMPKGGEIDINAENISKSNSKEISSLEQDRYVKISVRDYGAGIQKDHLANIFDPYFTTKQAGSGLGLASSYSIIKNHDGLITVESELGVGTTFYIYLQACSKEITKKKEKKNEP